MYEAFYGLKEKAFNLNPDPEYFYMSRELERQGNQLIYLGPLKRKKPIPSRIIQRISYIMRKRYRGHQACD